MERSPHYIRLFIATAAAVTSVVFSAFYSSLMTPIIRDRNHYVTQQLPLATYFFQHYAWYALVVPLSFLILGFSVLQRKKTGAVFEAAVGSQWLFAFVWLACCLLVWLFPELRYSEFIR
jgi:hypothetical protein